MRKSRQWMMSPTAAGRITEEPSAAELEPFPEEIAFNAYLDRLFTLLHMPVANGIARPQHRS